MTTYTCPECGAVWNMINDPWLGVVWRCVVMGIWCAHALPNPSLIAHFAAQARATGTGPVS